MNYNSHISTWSISGIESVVKLVESIRQKKKDVSLIIAILYLYTKQKSTPVLFSCVFFFDAKMSIVIKYLSIFPCDMTEQDSSMQWLNILAHLSLRLICELVVYRSLPRLSVCQNFKHLLLNHWTD